MKVAFGMPETLVLFSLFMYPQNFWFSIFAFSIGVLSRILAFAIVQQEKKEKQEIIGKAVTLLGSAVRPKPHRPAPDGDNGRFH